MSIKNSSVNLAVLNLPLPFDGDLTYIDVKDYSKTYNVMVDLSWTMSGHHHAYRASGKNKLDAKYNLLFKFWRRIGAM